MSAPPTNIDPALARQFAVEVVQKLRAAGFEALWAGGCVRDQLLGGQPKDYDVATRARPEEVRQVFGHKRTLAIGASFGVVTVLGPKAAGQIEIATFRQDAGYSDGRHPDSVTFSSAEEDAQRRDFTINGLFFDPIEERVIDYVGGVADLNAKIIRAIRNPHERFDEDKLRMLRAVRFAATFDFELEADTLAAIQEHAHEIVIVSAERIAAEMRRMLVHERRAMAVELLRESGLLEVVLPEARAFEQNDIAWRRTLEVLRRLDRPAFGTALAVLVQELGSTEYGVRSTQNQGPSGTDAIAYVVGERWRLSTDETELAAWLLRHEVLGRAAQHSPWPQVQRMLIQPAASELEKLLRALGEISAANFIAAKLALPPEELNPPPFISGDDLKALGLPPGPLYKQVLAAVRDAQLLHQITTKEAALALAGRLS